MFTLNRRDRVALHATLNQATAALFPMIMHAEQRALGQENGDDVRILVGDIREVADAITERRKIMAALDDTTPTAEMLAETVKILRRVAGSMEACATHEETTPEDWQAAADHAESKRSRLHGQRALMSIMFPVS